MESESGLRYEYTMNISVLESKYSSAFDEFCEDIANSLSELTGGVMYHKVKGKWRISDEIGFYFRVTHTENIKAYIFREIVKTCLKPYSHNDHPFASDLYWVDLNMRIVDAKHFSIK